jgi:AcrR family transcriptional regulator
MDLYSRAGWAGFNFEAITRATGIGKAAIYRRWPDRGKLLADVMKARWMTVEDINAGNLRDDLLQLVSLFFTRLTGPYGSAMVQMQADRLHYKEVREATDGYILQTVRAGRQIVRRAVARGELPSQMSPTLIIDLVVGGVQNHVLSTPPSLRPEMESGMHDFAQDLVESVLRGVLLTTRTSG